MTDPKRIITVPGEELPTQANSTYDDKVFVRIHLSIPKQFLDRIDERVSRSLITRSDFVRIALMDKLGQKTLYEDEADKLFRFKDNESTEIVVPSLEELL